ncbi:MAG: protein-L-isoaspartate O-methyltransferase [Rhodobacter sp.]|nr:protein-L-isoaspartate O-methyltransferase [Rhodobacter sp.]
MADEVALRTMMVDTQVRPSDVTKFPIIDAMLTVPRERFVPEAARALAYMDGNIDLGGGRVMVEPRTLAKMLDALDIAPDELVLDLGCGLGYSAAVIARLAEAVVALEEDAEMAAEAESRLAEAGVDNAAAVEGALAEGAAKHGPYDVIVVDGGVEEVPAAVTGQLKEGGRIAAVFMQGALGECFVGHKHEGAVNWRFAFNAAAPVLPGFARQTQFVL